MQKLFGAETNTNIFIITKVKNAHFSRARSNVNGSVVLTCKKQTKPTEI